MKKTHLSVAMGLWALSQPRFICSEPYRGQREDWQGRGKRPKPTIR